ncbi:MAG TPA: alanine dehydrogenase [Phycisphaerae bacterium]|nr:alanine dehydrogenase [Phycisphaerae bacterium]
MIIGVPKETKPDEYRIGMIPGGVEILVRGGHTVLVEKHGGVGSGISDEEYINVGAKIVDTAAEVWKRAELIVKVKEPLSAEWPLMQTGQIVLTYFHFAADRKLIQACLDTGIVAVAYETIKDRNGRLPCLTPMSEVAGKMSIQEGAKYLEKPMMGRGILLGGVPGVAPANVVVLGAGVVGHNAAKVAAGLGANVTIMDINLDRLRYLDDVMPANVHTVYSDPLTVREALRDADLVIGAVLIPGARAPRLVRREDLKSMKNGSVIVDVAIDQGGCVETAKPTTHKDPTYIVDGVVHYCVTNMPGAVGRTSTFALCNATAPYAKAIAEHGWDKAASLDAGLAEGLNLRGGRISHEQVRRFWEGD